MIRVLHYIGSLHIGGSQAFVMEMYRKTDREKVQFDFVTFPDEKGGHYQEILQLGGRVFECPRYKGTQHFAFCKWWDSFLREHPEYRIVHGHVRSCASIYMPIAKKRGCVTIAHSHSTSNGKGISALIKAILQRPIRYVADYLFSCSDKAGKWLFGEKAMHQANYRMIPNAVDCERFSFHEQTRLRIRRNLEISEDTFVVGHVGRFHEAKNHEFLIEVFKEIVQVHPNSKLLLIGDGELRHNIEQLCIECGIQEKVIFAGMQSDVASFYQAMDVFVFPSLWEGLPVGVVEAQSSGLPCLISETITKDVQLTDLVVYESLEKPAHEWAQKALLYANKERAGLTEQQTEQLKVFDSNQVAKELQEFYLGIVR